MTNDEPFRPSISVCAEAANKLADEIASTQQELDIVCTKWGMLSQKMLILTAALQETVKDMNGGTYPTPRSHQRFPELNHHG